MVASGVQVIALLALSDDGVPSYNRKAAADLAAARGGEGVSGFTAGSVSVRIRGAAESCALAESLRRTAERLMAPFAVPDDFCFRGVRG